jgi:hypothetical protein
MARDHQMAGMVGGGGTWLIEAVFGKYSDFWENYWSVTRQGAEDRKIWSVDYALTAERRGIVNMKYNQAAAKGELEDALTSISEFAEKQGFDHWCETVGVARERLNYTEPEKGYYNEDLIPSESYSLLSRQLLFAAGSAWVFGGMGSWNDLGFNNEKDNELYNSVSENLYDKIIKAIIAAINSELDSEMPDVI